jgi:hypothetical protein
MIKELHKREKETLTDDGQTLHLVTALTLTWMVMEHGINLNPECTTQLCEALLPSLALKRDNSSDINGLKDYFPSQLRYTVIFFLLFFLAHWDKSFMLSIVTTLHLLSSFSFSHFSIFLKITGPN